MIPAVERPGRRIPWLWVAAIGALGVGAGLFFVGRNADANDPNGDARSTIEDARGDVVGSSVAQVASLLDLRRVALERRDGDFTLELEHHEPIDRSRLADEPLTYAAQLRSGNVTYEVRASLGPSLAAATVTDTADLERPFALPAPTVRGARVRIAVPADAVPELLPTFAWGAAVRVAGSEDVAPSDRSSLFPPLEGTGQGSEPRRSKW